MGGAGTYICGECVTGPHAAAVLLSSTSDSFPLGEFSMSWDALIQVPLTCSHWAKWVSPACGFLGP